LPEADRPGRPWWRAASGLLLALLGLGAPAAGQSPSIPVQVGEVRLADVPIVLRGIGTVQPFNSVTIRAQVDGIIQSMPFTEGQEVRAGDVLVRIDPRPFQAALDQALARRDETAAELQNARLNLQRYQGVGDFSSRQQVATQQALVTQLEAQARGSEAAIQTARLQLAYTVIAAPITGVAGIRRLDEGNLVRSEDAGGIVVINQVRPISVAFVLPAEALADIRRGMAAGPLRVRVYGRLSQQVMGEGQLDLVDNQIDPATGTLRLKATLPNTDSALWPGLFVNVELVTGVAQGVRTVPSTAIQRGPDGTWLYTVQADGAVAAVAVAVNRIGDGIAVLDTGPEPGTRVVTGGHFRLVPGARVRAAEGPR